MTEKSSQAQIAAALFREVADRIEKFDPSEFGGAYLCIGPNPESAVIDNVLISKTPYEPSFWAVLKGQLDVAIAEVGLNDRKGPSRVR